MHRTNALKDVLVGLPCPVFANLGELFASVKRGCCSVRESERRRKRLIDREPVVGSDFLVLNQDALVQAGFSTDGGSTAAGSREVISTAATMVTPSTVRIDGTQWLTDWMLLLDTKTLIGPFDRRLMVTPILRIGFNHGDSNHRLMLLGGAKRSKPKVNLMRGDELLIQTQLVLIR